jgi:hypothetical protein
MDLIKFLNRKDCLNYIDNSKELLKELKKESKKYFKLIEGKEKKKSKNKYFYKEFRLKNKVKFKRIKITNNEINENENILNLLFNNYNRNIFQQNNNEDDSEDLLNLLFNYLFNYEFDDIKDVNLLFKLFLLSEKLNFIELKNEIINFISEKLTINNILNILTIYYENYKISIPIFYNIFFNFLVKLDENEFEKITEKINNNNLLRDITRFQLKNIDISIPNRSNIKEKMESLVEQCYYKNIYSDFKIKFDNNDSIDVNKNIIQNFDLFKHLKDDDINNGFILFKDLFEENFISKNSFKIIIELLYNIEITLPNDLLSYMEIFKLLEMLNLTEDALELLNRLEILFDLTDYLGDYIEIFFDNHKLNYSNEFIMNYFKNLFQKILNLLKTKKELDLYLKFLILSSKNEFYNEDFYDDFFKMINKNNYNEIFSFYIQNKINDNELLNYLSNNDDYLFEKFENMKLKNELLCFRKEFNQQNEEIKKKNEEFEKQNEIFKIEIGDLKNQIKDLENKIKKDKNEGNKDNHQNKKR